MLDRGSIHIHCITRVVRVCATCQYIQHSLGTTDWHSVVTLTYTGALLLVKVDFSGDSLYKNPKEGVLGFPVVPNMSTMR